MLCCSFAYLICLSGSQLLIRPLSPLDDDRSNTLETLALVERIISLRDESLSFHHMILITSHDPLRPGNVAVSTIE